MTEHPDRLLSSVVSAMADCVAEVERLRAALDEALPRYAVSLSMEHNRHKGYYETVEQALATGTYDAQDFRDADAIEACIEADSVWEVLWFPDTPNGSFCVCAPTLADALAFAKEVGSEDDRKHGR